MKKIILLTALITSSLFISAQVGVGTLVPDANAQLDIVSSTKGMLIPRLDAGEVTTLAGNLDANDNGMMIYNTTEKCLQIWKWVTTPTPGGSFECVAVVSGGGTGNDGAVKVNTAPGTATIAMSKTGSSVGPWVTLNTTAANLTLSSPPTTSWPENQPIANQNLAGIYTDQRNFGNGTTADAWVENGVLGQVNIWRIIVEYNQGSASIVQIECRIRNPLSTFETTSVQTLPAGGGVGTQTFVLYTIADGASLPSPLGMGLGYVIDFRANDNTSIRVNSVTRISTFKD